MEDKDEKIMAMIARHVPSRLTVEADKTLSELEIDSLDMVEFHMMVEEEFDIEIPDEAINDWRVDMTVKELVASVSTLTA